jgi:hypothetical protein
MCIRDSRQHYVLATRLWAEALAADPRLANDLQAARRYEAASSAALAAAGQAEDAAPLDDQARVGLRKQALAWLRADLALLESSRPSDPTAAHQALRRWQEDSDLADLRDAAALTKLPAAERTAFTQLWADVAMLVQKAHAQERTLPIASALADRDIAAGRTQDALVHMATLSAGKPEDTVLSLKVAALQAWFGQEKELAATRQRILAFAKGTSDSGTADHGAKACSILPSADKAELEAVLALGRKAVEFGKGGQWQEWNLLALGMAEYRSGNDAAAVEALLAAVKAGPNNTIATGIAGFYRAMSLFRQGKKNEARKVAVSATAQMKPLPKDEQNPLPNNAAPWDDLILWLAYKEAKALIQFDATAALQKAKELHRTSEQKAKELLRTSAAANREIAAGRTQDALAHLTVLYAANPEATILFLRLAALQAWFGQDKEFAATCRRGLEWAKSTTVPDTAERVAKGCCLLPSTDKAQLEAVLALARKAVQLDKASRLLPFSQMALGMAEYRSGHFAEADTALLAAAQAGKDHIRGVAGSWVSSTSGFYRAMSLFRQGKENEARELAIEAVAGMNPLPKDEKNPLAGKATHDDMILWLAYKEAKAFIRFDAVPEFSNWKAASKVAAPEKK